MTEASCALAIGNFDGVHLGHQKLLADTVSYARNHNLVPATLTFYPHPTVVVAPDRVPLLLCSLEERIRLIKATGIQQVFVIPFTAELAALTPREFVRDFLVERFCARALFVGDNFRFGVKKAGTTETLRELAPEFGFEPRFLAPVTFRGEVVSSSAIRSHIANGQIYRANRLLGRVFSVSGKVVTGHGIGSRQTVPTLNLDPEPERIIPRGVYVSEILELPNGRRWESITNAGTRPTFNGKELTVETFLLSPFEEPAPSEIEVRFHHFIRPERHFPDSQSLKSQIFKDIARARSYWRHLRALATRIPSIY
ncbi:MAG: bifunctional riboflavin kinase/FAD synthetase [Acidobacteriaceae bacterium]|nr:bifunctional riboflavin kinase/FAD synthetase [Acidobacteriaceae bacterium]